MWIHPNPAFVTTRRVLNVRSDCLWQPRRWHADFQLYLVVFCMSRETRLMLSTVSYPLSILYTRRRWRWKSKIPPSVKCGRWYGFQHPPYSPDLAQVIVTCFSTSRNFCMATFWGMTERRNTLCRTGWVLATTFNDESKQKLIPRNAECPNVHCDIISSCVTPLC